MHAQILKRLRSKLASLNYPGVNDFVYTNSNHVRNLIVWLEDRVIRFYPVEKRLRDSTSNEWPDYIHAYLTALKCPYTEDDPPALCDWLIGKALILDYKSDDASSHVKPQQDTGHDIFGHVDVHGNAFKEAVTKLCRLLQIPAHPDPSVMFKAACILIDQKLGKGKIEQALNEYGKVRMDFMQISEVCLGFDIDDPEVRAAAVALRLLNVAEMRRLQDQANAAIVQVQKLTADPKTDETLGKVGF